MKLAAFDPDGHYLAAIDEVAADRALARREAVRISNGIQLRASAASDIRKLTPEEKRRQYLRKHGR